MMNNILSDLDDFIAPTQECIKMIIPPKPGQPQKPGGGDADATTKALQVQIGNDFDDGDFEMKVEMNQN